LIVRLRRGQMERDGGDFTLRHEHFAKVRERALRLVESGLSQSATAKIVGVQQSVISRWVREGKSCESSC
jgi:hypothetical protein